MKKFLALIIALVMALSLVACGEQKQPDNPDVPDDGQQTASVKVGFITLHDENSTYDLNFINAAKEACETLGVEYTIVTNVPEGQECYDKAAELADAGCNIIFADSFGHEPYMIDAAKAHPEVQFIWQTGKYYSAAVADRLKDHKKLPMLKVCDFISDMGAAYKAADLVISRAGASSISEFCLIGKPVVLVPSPNVAEDHQTKNAMALVNKNAALYVRDADAPQTLLQLAVDTVKDDEQLAQLSENIKKLESRTLPTSSPKRF